LQEKAAAEEEYATSETAAATSEEERAVQSVRQAAIHGAKACVNGIVAAVLGCVTVLFFIGQCIVRLLSFQFGKSSPVCYSATNDNTFKGKSAWYRHFLFEPCRCLSWVAWQCSAPVKS
jgi:hypothetical protein